MATFLFVTASVAVVMGLVGLVVGSVARAAGRPQGPRLSIPAREQGARTGVHGEQQVGRSIERRRATIMT